MKTMIKRLMMAMIMIAGVAGNSLMAQTTLLGTVVNSKNEPIPFATVAMLSNDSTVITGTVADENGKYALKVNSEQECIIAASCIGYNTEYKTINTKQSTPITMQLTASATMLETVEINAKAPVIEQKMDKLVMNVAQSAFAQGNNAMDLLRKAPGVSVDKDGNVKLNGQDVAIWIDGRPSQLDGKSLEALLQSTDGASLDKIEVIANPSAKYDASGNGGIINIKTKRNFMQGFNGSIGIKGAAMNFGRKLDLMQPTSSAYADQDLYLNLNYRTAKTNTFFQLSEGTNNMGVDVVFNTDLNKSGVDFMQKSISCYDAHTLTANLKLGNDWFIDKKNTLGVIFTMPIYSMRQWADTNKNRSYQMVSNNITQQIMTNAETEYHFSQYMGNVNYTHIFNEAKAAELTANLDYMHFVNQSNNPLINYYLSPSQELSWLSDSIMNAQRTVLAATRKVDVYSAKADWQSVVFGRFMMEAGGKWALSQTDNEMNRTLQTLLPIGDPVETTTLFDYNEHIGALYATLAGQIKPGWTAKAGLRGEYTYAYNSDNTVNQNYFNLFPTLYAGYNTPDMMKRYSISYTRRIQRPNYQQLNPFQNFVDAHTSNIGNPNLQPSLSDNVNISAGFGRYITLSGIVLHTSAVIGFTPQIDPANGNQTLFADNIGTNSLWGGSLTLSELPLSKILTLMLSAQLYDFKSQVSSSIAPMVGATGYEQGYLNRSLYGSGYACLTWLLPKGWKIQVDGFLTSPVTQGYIHTDWNYAANIAVKKSSLDGKLLFMAGINDLFRSMNANFNIMMNGMVMGSYNQKYLTQKVKVGLQWNFGTAQKPLPQRNVGNLDEADRTGSSNSLGQ